MAFPPNLMAALAGGQAPQGNAAATAALSRGIAALHQYLDLETDPKKRATATVCLSKLEPLRGEHMAPPDQGQGSPAPSGAGPPGY